MRRNTRSLQSAIGYALATTSDGNVKMTPSRNIAAPTGLSQQSSWRLVNLSLGLSSAVGFAGALGVAPYLVPSRWLIAPWLSRNRTADLSIVSVFLARIGINLWLPASVLILVFMLLGLHRRTGAIGARWAAPTLTIVWILGIVVALVPFMIGHGEAAGALMFVAGMLLSPLYLAATAGGVAAAINEWQAVSKGAAGTDRSSSSGLLCWAVIPPVLLTLPLLAFAR